MPDPVLDVMVAMTFPEKFVIERPTYTASYGGGGGAWGGGGLDPWSMASEYGVVVGLRALRIPVLRLLRSALRPRLWLGRRWLRPSAAASVEPDANGRVINGAGYTRVRPREAEPSG